MAAKVEEVYRDAAERFLRQRTDRKELPGGEDRNVRPADNELGPRMPQGYSA